MLLVVEDRIQRFEIVRIRIEPGLNVLGLDVDDRAVVPRRRDFWFRLIAANDNKSGFPLSGRSNVTTGTPRTWDHHLAA